MPDFSRMNSPLGRPDDSSVSILLVGTYLVKQAAPDFSEQAEFEDRLTELIEMPTTGRKWP